MRVTLASGAFFFDVCHFSRAANVTIPADHTATWQRSEAEEPDYAHELLRRPPKQVQCREMDNHPADGERHLRLKVLRIP